MFLSLCKIAWYLFVSAVPPLDVVIYPETVGPLTAGET